MGRSESYRRSRSPIFDLQFTQDVLNMLANCAGRGSQDNGNLIIGLALRNPSQNLCLALGQPQQKQ